METVEAQRRATSKEFSSYNEWFISAIKSSKVDGAIDEKTLLANSLNCQEEVRKLLASSDEKWIGKYDEFRLNSLTLLILGCPTVHLFEEIAASRDLQPLIKSIPPLTNSQLFFIIQGLKNYRYLRGVLPWLPTKCICKLLSQFILHSKNITLLTFAVSFEMLYGIVNSLPYWCIKESDIHNVFEEYGKLFLSKKLTLSIEQQSKFAAYFFMYLLESLYLLVHFLIEKKVEDPITTSLSLKLKTVRKKEIQEISAEVQVVVKNLAHVLLTVCYEIAPLVTSSVWIDWHSIKAPMFGINSEKNNNIHEKSVQLTISHTAFKLIREKNSKLEIFELPEYLELAPFFRQIATDPDYDPDIDLTNQELVECLKEETTNKKKKYINILLSREEIFNSQDILDCTKLHGQFLEKVKVIPFLERLIDHLLVGSPVLEEWKSVVLQLVKMLPSEKMLDVMKRKLRNGEIECLKTDDFLSDVTHVFNQLAADPSKTQCYDACVWLCLQSGVYVVAHCVQVALSFPGLVPIIASVLKKIAVVCRIKSEGISLVTKLLKKKLTKIMTEEELQHYTSLVTILLQDSNIPEEQDMVTNISEQTKNEESSLLPLNAVEVLDFLILPYMQVTEKGIPKFTVSALEILEVFVKSYRHVIFQSQTKLLNLLISLGLIYHTCSMLSSDNYLKHLDIRISINNTMASLLPPILQDKNEFTSVIIVVKQILRKYNLHPRCMVLLSSLVEPLKPHNLTSTDEVFQLICNPKLSPKNISAELYAIERINWIWSLYVILPHCSGNEWLIASNLTHSYLKSSSTNGENLIASTLKVLQEVLLLLCSNVLIGKRKCENEISLYHCFKSFSNSSMKFISENIQHEEIKQQFHSLMNFFKWWCRVVRMFKCDIELPSLFLYNLCVAIYDIFNSKALIVVGQIAKSKPKSKTSKFKKLQKKLITSETKSETSSSPSISDVDSNSGPEKQTSKNRKVTIDRKEFEEHFTSLVKVFVTHVPLNKIGLSIAGKLKSIFELA